MVRRSYGPQFSLLVLAVVSFIAVPPVTAQSGRLDAWMRTGLVDRAQEPQVYHDTVVFTYEPQSFTRYVAAAFAHEGYRELHVFSVRERPEEPDLFYLAYPVDPSLGELSYRLVVDGVWMADPNAPRRSQDARGVEIGHVALESAPQYEARSPDIRDNGTVTFRFSADLGVGSALETVRSQTVRMGRDEPQDVYLVGSFNGWDPFAHRLSGPDEHGFFHTTLRLPEGSHYYYYLVDGERLLDPLNGRQARDRQTDTLVSRLVVPAQ